MTHTRSVAYMFRVHMVTHTHTMLVLQQCPYQVGIRGDTNQTVDAVSWNLVVSQGVPCCGCRPCGGFCSHMTANRSSCHVR